MLSLAWSCLPVATPSDNEWGCGAFPYKTKKIKTRLKASEGTVRLGHSGLHQALGSDQIGLAITPSKAQTSLITGY